MRFRLHLCLLTFLSAPLSVRAQEADTLDAAMVYTVESLSITRPAESLLLSASAVRPPQMADIIRRFGGVQVKDYGGAGGLKTVNVRSMGSEHVGVFLNGIQIDNAQNMQVDLGRLGTDGELSVELYNGTRCERLQTAREYTAGSCLYISSARPVSFDKNGGTLRLRSGSFGTVNPSVAMHERVGGTTLLAKADLLCSNGRYKYPYFDTTLVRENGDIRALRAELEAFGGGRSGQWQLQLYEYCSERGFPGPVVRRAMEFPLGAERQADNDLFAQGKWEHWWSHHLESALRFKLSSNCTHYNSHPEKNPMAVPADIRYRQKSAYLSAAHEYAVSNSLSLGLSSDFQYNDLESDAGRFVSPSRTSFIQAAAARYAGRLFRASASIAYYGSWDHFDSSGTGGWDREDRYRRSFTPSASFMFEPYKWLGLDVFAKRSYRLPSFNDLYYSQIGNSSLEPESALQTGADIRLKITRRKIQTETRISPYYNRVREKIVAIPTVSQFRWTMLNIGKVDITGLDLRESAHFCLGNVYLDAILRYSFQQALDHSTPGSLTWGNQIPYIPLHSGSADMLVSFGDWTAAWDTTLTGGRWSRTANTDDYRLEPWTLSDFTLSRTVFLEPSAKRARVPELRISLALNNIFDRHYEVVQGYPMPGLNFMFTLEYQW